MVVYNFHFMRAVLHPDEADAPLVVDSDGMLALAVAFQCFQSIAWRNSEMFQFCHRMKLHKLSKRCALEVRRNRPYLFQPE